MLLCVAFISCQDQDDLVNNAVKDKSIETVANVLPRLVFSTREDLKESLKLLDSGLSQSVAMTRAAVSNCSFKSLAEVSKEKFYSTLTKEQIDSINNDDDEIEYCPEDSIVHDEDFSQLVNADREVQVGDTVYKYIKGGVAYTNIENASSLKFVDKVNTNSTNGDNCNNITVVNGVTLQPIEYTKVLYDENTDSKTRTTRSENPLVLKDGTKIPCDKVRYVDYSSQNDEGFVHHLWSSLWGKDVQAIYKINKSKKIILTLSSQNYLFYARIKTKIKMQKKKFGIWWNIKADDMKLGCNAMELVSTFKNDVNYIFNQYYSSTHPTSGEFKLPSHILNNFPFKNSITLLSVPFVNYKITGSNINNWLLSYLESQIGKRITAIDNNNKWQPYNNSKSMHEKCMEQIKNGNYGVYTTNGKFFYSLVGMDENTAGRRCKNIEYNFWKQNLPMFDDFQVCFSYNIGTGNYKFESFKLSTKPKIELGRGIVYGAVKYGGQWYGAQITKNE